MKKIIFLILLILLILFLFTSTTANTFLVTNQNASGTGSLEQAVVDANALPGQDTILFASTVRGTIYNDGVLQLTDGVVMIGPGPDLLAVSADYKGRVIYIDYWENMN